MNIKTKEELLIENTMYKIDLLCGFLRDQLRLYSRSSSDWAQGNHNAYEITLDLLNTFFKEDK